MFAFDQTVVKAASRSLRTQCDDERIGEVGQLHSTWEVTEQRLQGDSGGEGGKGAGQGEPAQA